MSQITDEIKSKIDIIDLLSEYIQLKPAGANFRAVCPFHHEKTPSFMVSRPKQIWHCFGCGAGGDIFGFVMKIEGLEFPEALRLLAEKAGVKLSAYSNELSSSARNRLLDVLKLSAAFYHRVLLDSPRSQLARDYLNQRGVSPEMIEEFQIGFIPDEWDLLTKFLLKKGFGINDIAAAGLSLKKEGGSSYYDRFRGRVVFPLNDVHGNVVGFTGRLLNENQEKASGKYVNTPQTSVYDKSKVVYGLDKAKQEIKRQDGAIMVEGQMDVLACHQAGQFNVVASSGTALTMEQIKLLKRFSHNLIMAFDADLAGQNAAERGIETALSEDMKIKVIQIPEGSGKDPDECLKKNPAIWFKAVEQAENIMDYFFRKFLAGKNLQDSGERSAVAKALLLKIGQIPDVVEQDFWLKKLANILDIPINILRERLGDLKRSLRVAVLPSASIGEAPARDRTELASERLLALLLRHQDIFKLAVDRLKIAALAPPLLQNLFRDFLVFCQSQEVIHSFGQWTKIPQACQTIDILDLLYEREFANFKQEELVSAALEMVNSLNLWYTAKECRRIEKEMKEAEASGNKEKAAELLKKFRELI